ncbi:DUF4173 domain-containing protein [Myxococcus llanfairpwllgwyngyllgogerychwyrndrobwllllantysiliogogogochensis]|uniref:DUF4173 domain-containing protein n=1 Tax=Myxococcus llanfairpwllgwyngyllgogerychwyrndrobwllllantysiliogogogochensis TaxID=2590453 RepID=A0A540X1T8_9BACT|nr:DUF4173 domain-containing protein [Myxococcus llanfairpwllgwyngyllgogerychwyrndrobwllllantysiliogogogochensis]TQF15218.1 DUF4173 domain-containing protein [Myxococcus llanfairpwllgwyngyllgogerychwyrndrobwllllantysiliogogogochensis]
MSSTLSPMPLVAPSAPPPLPSTPWLPQARAPRRTLVAALALGGLAEVLLDRPHWGVSFPLMALSLVAVLVGLGGREGWQRARPNAWLLGPLLAVAGFVAVRDSPWLVVLNVLTAGTLLLLLMHFWGAGRVQRLGLGGYPGVVLGTALRGLLHPPALVRDSVDLGAAKRQAPRLMPFARGVLLAVPVLAVFAMLLSSADAMFASAVQRVWSVDVGALLGASLIRGMGVLLCAGLAASALGHALRRRTGSEAGEAEVAPASPRLGLTEALTLILAVDALFFAFAGFQVAYLFIGDASSPAPGYSYAEYARRGFFELMVVSMLTLGLVMALARWTRRESPLARTVFQAGASIMVALTLVIVASAVQRMTLYEDAFGYTRLRLFTHVFMFALGVVLAWRGVTLWWRPERFAVGAFVTALGAVLAVNVINPDALIVRLNLTRGEPGSSVDSEYLHSLSGDAVPELVRGLSSGKLEGVAHLKQHYVDVCEDVSWPEWSLSRWRACRALESVEEARVSAGGS